MQDLRITIIQSQLAWENSELNLEKFSARIESLTDETDLIVLPEMFSSGFSMNPQLIAQPMDGQAVAWMKATALSKNCIVCGSLAIVEDGRYYNRFIWASPDGSLLHYDKKHLFTFAGEHRHYTAGASRQVFELKGWKISPLICYDLRFPVWSRNRYSKENGYEYDCLLYVANWPEARSHAWRILLMARAIENQSFVVGVNRVGADGNQIAYSGDSAVLDPLGENLSSLMPFSEGIQTVVLSRGNLDSYREKFNQRADWENFSLASTTQSEQ